MPTEYRLAFDDGKPRNLRERIALVLFHLAVDLTGRGYESWGPSGPWLGYMRTTCDMIDGKGEVLRYRLRKYAADRARAKGRRLVLTDDVSAVLPAVLGAMLDEAKPLEDSDA